VVATNTFLPSGVLAYCESSSRDVLIMSTFIMREELIHLTQVLSRQRETKHALLADKLTEIKYAIISTCGRIFQEKKNHFAMGYYQLRIERHVR
jgi:hypothetical protein